MSRACPVCCRRWRSPPGRSPTCASTAATRPSGISTSRRGSATTTPTARAELREWVPKLRELDAQVDLTLVYFNNHYVGQAVKGARDLGQLLLGLA